MCHRCNYSELIDATHLKPTDNRVLVLEAIGANAYPLSADDIFRILARTRTINRVTVYRILTGSWNTVSSSG